MRFERFETAGHVRLEVECESGSIDVTTAGSPVSEVSVSSDAEVSELLDQATIDCRTSGGARVVRVRFPKRWSLFRRGDSVRISVVVPEGTDLSVQTASADVDATGRFGRVDAETASGSVTLDEGTDVRLRSASGDLSVGTAEGADVRSVSGEVVVGRARRPARLSSSSGSVHLGTASSPCKVETVSGSIDVDLAESGLRIKTISGDVDVRCVASGEVVLGGVSGSATLGIPPGRAIEVDAQSLSGNLTSEFDLEGARWSDAGGPRVVVKSTSVSGDLRIVRAGPPPAPRTPEPTPADDRPVVAEPAGADDAADRPAADVPR